MTESSENQVTESLETRIIRERLSFLQHFLGLGGIVLVLESWQLWSPQKVYPQVPFFSQLLNQPDTIHYIFGFVIAFCLLLILLIPRSKIISRMALIGFVLFAVASVSLNQHRFQPWMYHLIISAAILAWASGKPGIRCLQMIIISIYVYSAFSKMDSTFPELTGKRILYGIFQVIDYDAKFMSPERFRLLVYLIPAGELLTAILLFFKRTRFVGLLFSLIMHSVLILTFSPLGLNHYAGVLIWNGYFIGQNIALFWPVSKKQLLIQQEQNTKRSFSFGNIVATLITVPIITLPILEPWGYFDHWPAWGLYSSRQERVRVSIHESAVNQLDEELKKYLEPVQFNHSWRRLRIHQWSLETLKAPMYPQDRFQVGVALAVGKKYQIGNYIRLEREGVADRRTGARKKSEYTGMQEIEQFAKTFRLNAIPSNFK